MICKKVNYITNTVDSPTKHVVCVRILETTIVSSMCREVDTKDLDAHTRTHTRTPTHTRTHTHTHTHTYTRAHTHTHTRAHTHTQAHAHTHTPTHTHAQAHAHTHTHTHTRPHTHTRMCFQNRSYSTFTQQPCRAQTFCAPHFVL